MRKCLVLFVVVHTSRVTILLNITSLSVIIIIRSLFVKIRFLLINYWLIISIIIIAPACWLRKIALSQFAFAKEVKQLCNFQLHFIVHIQVRLDCEGGMCLLSKFSICLNILGYHFVVLNIFWNIIAAAQIIIFLVNRGSYLSYFLLSKET